MLKRQIFNRRRWLIPSDTFRFIQIDQSVILMVNCLLGPFIFTVVNTKKRPAITIALHTAWAHALSTIVIGFPQKSNGRYSDKIMTLTLMLTLTLTLASLGSYWQSSYRWSTPYWAPVCNLWMLQNISWFYFRREVHVSFHFDSKEKYIINVQQNWAGTIGPGVPPRLMQIKI